VTGTFLTSTGDYRFLAGDYEGGVLRLSCFDGAHAFLFRAEAVSETTLRGDFWSRGTYHATWTARRIDADSGEDGLPDPFETVGLTNDEGRLHFTFPDLDGAPVSLSDQRFAGDVVLVSVFGTWCPNCNDEAPLLARWHRKYREQGLQIIGLAYEFTGEPERDRRMVRLYAERHGLEFPLLLAGVNDKKAAGETLPDLTAVLAYPTTIFVGRDGRVRKIHSGFAGPGTGEHHQRLVARMEAVIEELLAEPASPVS
jgi:peroxiredoxin